jgi:hypothetical protein
MGLAGDGFGAALRQEDIPSMVAWTQDAAKLCAGNHADTRHLS